VTAAFGYSDKKINFSVPNINQALYYGLATPLFTAN
jgi:hypothetical protein